MFNRYKATLLHLISQWHPTRRLGVPPGQAGPQILQTGTKKHSCTSSATWHLMRRPMNSMGTTTCMCSLAFRLCKQVQRSTLVRVPFQLLGVQRGVPPRQAGLQTLQTGTKQSMYNTSSATRYPTRRPTRSTTWAVWPSDPANRYKAAHVQYLFSNAASNEEANELYTEYPLGRLAFRLCKQE
jgi:hypothetical protein